MENANAQWSHRAQWMDIKYKISLHSTFKVKTAAATAAAATGKRTRRTGTNPNG